MAKYYPGLQKNEITKFTGKMGEHRMYNIKQSHAVLEK